MAVVECSRELYDKVEKRGSLLIGYVRCRVDSSIKLMRCKECGLLGHTKNHCPGLSEDMQKLRGSLGTRCLDCETFNKRIKGTSYTRTRFRNTEHPTGIQQCRTLGALLQKFKKARQPAEVGPVAS